MNPAARDGLAFVFPGQGSQYPGMGHELRSCGAAARSVLPAAEELTGLPLAELMLRADAATLADPEVAQLVVFVLSLALDGELRHRGVAPSIVAGHSLGEYTALASSGSLDWPVALTIVAARGRAMAAAARLHPGTMAVVAGLSAELVGDLCAAASAGRDLAVLANLNSPRQVVVSGTVEAVEAVCAAATAAGALRARRLPVGGAYHSPLMAGAERTLWPLVERTTLRPPRTALVSSITGRPVDDVGAHHRELLGQITAPVRWRAAVDALAAAGVTRCVEVGPGRVLGGIGREMLRGTQHHSAPEALRDADRSRSTEGALR